MKIEATSRLSQLVASLDPGTLQGAVKKLTQVLEAEDTDGMLSLGQAHPSDLGIEFVASGTLCITRRVARQLLEVLKLLEAHGADEPMIFLKGVSGGKIAVEIVDYLEDEDE